jgi:hypothetical protein
VRTFVVRESVSSPSTAALNRLSDVRVTQFWDKGRAISHLMGEHDGLSVVWDYIAVCPAGAIWENLQPSSLYHSNPVVQMTERLGRR